MSKKQTIKPVSAAIGAALAGSLAATPGAQAADNPFAMTELSSGYMVAMEGKCGGSMNMKNMGEGKCGNMKNMKKHEDDKSSKEGKCGEGKCGEGMRM